MQTQIATKTPLNALKQQGIDVPNSVDEAAIAAVTAPIVAAKPLFRLFFKGPMGRLCRGITESVAIEVTTATTRRTKFHRDEEHGAKLSVCWNDAGNNANERTYFFAHLDRESLFENVQESLGDMDYEFAMDVLCRFETMSNVDFYEPNLRDLDAAVVEACDKVLENAGE